MIKRWVRLGIWAGGVLFGTAGVALLKSDDAKKVYTHAAAAAKRCGDNVMKTVTSIRENCADINADANEINEERARQKEEREIADAKALIAEYEAKNA